MKVILIKDVKGMGRAHDTVEAKDGYALNYLIPKKLAIAATESAVKEAGERKKVVASRSEVAAKLMAQNLATLAEKTITIRVKANEKGHLYDAVGESEMLAALKAEERVELPEGSVRLEKPIKELGAFDVPVSVGELFGKFSLTIEAE